MGFFSYGQIVEQVATVSASGTTSLSSTSKQIQYFNGTSAQTVQLPATSGMTVGQFFEIYNVGTNSLTVQFADATSFTPAPTIQTSGSLIVKLVNLTASSGTATNGIWAYSLSSENLSGNVTIGGNLTVNGTTSSQEGFFTTGGPIQVALRASGSGAGGMGIEYQNQASSGHYNWYAGAQNNASNSFEITPSTATDGSTFSTPVFTIAQSGNAVVSGNLNVNGGTGITLAEGTAINWNGTNNLIYGSNTSNFVRIRTNGTDAILVDSGQNTKLVGRVSIGSAGVQSNWGLIVTGVGLTGTTQVGLGDNSTYSTASGVVHSILSAPTITTNTISKLHHFLASTASVSSGALTTEVGFYYPTGSSATNTAALTDNDTFTGNWFINQSGTANSTLGGALTLPGSTGNAVINLGSQSAVGNGAAIKFVPSSTATNWLVGSNFNVAGALEFTPSTSGGGTSFTTPALKLDTSSNATFSGKIVAGSSSVDVQHTLENSSTSNYVLGVINANATTSSDSTAAMFVQKGSTTVTTSQRFLQFIVNNGATNYGYITANGSGVAPVFAAASDRRIKKNIAPMSGALDKVAALNPVNFNLKTDTADATKAAGFIAQEFAEVFPEFVHKTDDGKGDELPSGTEAWSMGYGNLVPYLVAALKELKAEFDAYKKAHP